MEAAGTGEWFWWALTVVLALGIIPATFFLLTWRPANWRRGIALDLRASILSLLAIYLLAGTRAFVDRETPSSTVGVVYLLVFAAIDAHLWGRAIMWERYRRRWRADVDRRAGIERRRQQAMLDQSE